MTITDIQIRNTKPAAKPVRLYDGDGLYVEVRPSGGRWWRFKYRHEGKEKLISLGTYPEVSLADARSKRAEARALVAAGTDPSAARQQAGEERKQAELKASLKTVDAVSRAWLAHRAPAWTAGTLAAITASLENHVFPALGSRPIAEVSLRDIKRVVQAVDKTGAGETAGRVFQRLRSIYQYALVEELIEHDLTYALKPAGMLRPREVAHRRSLAEADMPEFYHRLAAYEGDPTTTAALELLVLTAVRPGELRGAQWREFDDAKSTWRIPAARMKMKSEHVVPMSTEALAVLARLRPLSGTGELVFPSPFYPGKPISDGTLNSALARLGYKGTATAHGFRTLFSTCANEHGWRGELVEKQLAHEERDGVRGAYNRAQYLAERHKLMQWWGGEVARMRATQA